MGTRSLSWMWLLPAVALLLSPGELRAQEGECDIASGITRSIEAGEGNRILYMWLGVTVDCDDGTRIVADSAVVYQASNFTQLFRNIRFVDAESEHTSDRAHNFTREKRLVAWGNAVLTDNAQGSVISGDTILILQASEYRPEDQLTVTGHRPHAVIYVSPTEPPTEEPDSAEALPGSVQAEEDSLAAVDTIRAPADSLAAVDTTRAPPDSLAAVDTTRAPPDSLAAHPDTAQALPDSLRIPVDSLLAQAETAEDTLPPEEVVEEGASGTEGAEAPADTVKVPYDITADRIFLEGTQYLRATGAVEIRRDSMEAFADSVEYDRRAGRLFLTDNARIAGTAYDLTGRLVTLLLPGEDLREVVAREDAVLTAEQVTLTAPRIHVYLVDGLMDRLVALNRLEDPVIPQVEEGEEGEGPGPEEAIVVEEEEEGPELPRPEALAEDFLLVADSIEVLSPGEVLREVFAAGRARGESLGRDSLNREDTPELIRRDWLEGDTIVATFVPAGGGEETPGEAGVPPRVEDPPGTGEGGTSRGEFELERLVARVDARSLYRLQASDTTAAAAEEGRLAVHYVTGTVITIHMRNGEVERMEVEDARGFHMEPIRRGNVSATPPEERRGGSR